MLEFEFLCDHSLQLLYSGHHLFVDRGRLHHILVPGGIVNARNKLMRGRGVPRRLGDPESEVGVVAAVNV